MTEESRVEQMGAVLKDLAALSESQTAQLSGLAGRLEALETRLAATQAMQSHVAERLERLAGDLDVTASIASLTDQLAALRAAQAQSGTRLESLASDMTRVSRLDAALGHLRDEVAAKADAAERALRGELAAVRQSQERDAGELGRQVHAILQQLETIGPLADTTKALERRQAEADTAAERLAARFDEVGALRQEVSEALKRSALHLEARVAGMADSVEALTGEVGGWRGRIEAQAEAVREARGIADGMRAEAERLATVEHAAAEGQRLFEARMQAGLADLRTEVDHAWEQFKQSRDRQWSSLTDANASRDRALAAFEASLAVLGERIEAMERNVARELETRSAALQALRADVAAALASWRDATAQSVDLIEAALPRGEKSSFASERREAVRLALKARRDEPPN